MQQHTRNVNPNGMKALHELSSGAEAYFRPVDPRPKLKVPAPLKTAKAQTSNFEDPWQKAPGGGRYFKQT